MSDPRASLDSMKGNEMTKILYKTDPGCKRCTTDPYVPHFNCVYGGRAVGHSGAHCTADACY